MARVKVTDRLLHLCILSLVHVETKERNREGGRERKGGGGGERERVPVLERRDVVQTFKSQKVVKQAIKVVYVDPMEWGVCVRVDVLVDELTLEIISELEKCSYHFPEFRQE